MVIECVRTFEKDVRPAREENTKLLEVQRVPRKKTVGLVIS